jgi:hypothetical protein
MPPFFRALLYLYPSAYRREFGEEMLAVLTEIKVDLQDRGLFCRVAFHARETGGLLLGALREHFRNLNVSQEFPTHQRRSNMRSHSEFRFPKSTVALMAVILLAIITAIEKAKAISESVPHSNPAVGPIQPAYVAIVPSFLILLALVSVGGALVWAVLFALHRSGVQRLSEINPSVHPQSRSGVPT